ncbi:MAG TPA: hypothetical protein VFO10_13080 [Oligoflexus sp.]|uniref:hypothetical protein n=1 Tax=Oligoflexus sp. TaxID=1971216 RepID=UPI002D7E9495|nr:hypothetical protein [Oligoflexus sp.]HET9238186.1 hypothetical protein [Oligoflexus sp.]
MRPKMMQGLIQLLQEKVDGTFDVVQRSSRSDPIKDHRIVEEQDLKLGVSITRRGTLHQ